MHSILCRLPAVNFLQVAFKTGDYKQQVIFIGGLTDGFLATEYVSYYIPHFHLPILLFFIPFSMFMFFFFHFLPFMIWAKCHYQGLQNILKIRW